MFHDRKHDYCKESVGSPSFIYFVVMLLEISFECSLIRRDPFLVWTWSRRYWFIGFSNIAQPPPWAIKYHVQILTMIWLWLLVVWCPSCHQPLSVAIDYLQWMYCSYCTTITTQAVCRTEILIFKSLKHLSVLQLKQMWIISKNSCSPPLFIL